MAQRISDQKLTDSGMKKIEEAKSHLPIEVWGVVELSVKDDRTLSRLLNGSGIKKTTIEDFSKAYNKACKDNHLPDNLKLVGIDIENVRSENKVGQEWEDKGFEQCVGILQTSREEGIVSIYRRGDRLYDRINEAISQADEYIYTIARTHRLFLIQDGGIAGWGIEALTTSIERLPHLSVRMLLADSFAANSGYRLELDTYFDEVAARSNYHAGRDVVRGTVREIDKLQKHNFRMGLLPLTPPYCMLMTEQSVFWEPYLPATRGGECIVIEAKRRSVPSENGRHKRNLHDSFLQDFIRQYILATPVSEAILKYIQRKGQEGTLSSETKTRDEKIIQMALKWEAKPENDSRIIKVKQ